MRKRSFVVALALSLVASVLGLTVRDAVFLQASAAAANPTRISVASDGTQANGNSLHAAVSADGNQVAFSSSASNLVSGDTNGVLDVFVRDVNAETTTRLSVASDGTQGTGGTISEESVAISANGRFVAFESDETNLVSSDTNGFTDIFVHDRDLDGNGVFDETGAGKTSTVRVSVDSSGAQANGQSLRPSISADGRYVAFQSNATNLVASDTNTARDIFVHDRDSDHNGVFDEASGTSTTRASVSSSGTQANSDSAVPAISGNGLFVVFSSNASNLETPDNNAVGDIFRRDGVAGLTTMVTRGPGFGGNQNSDSPSISADGRVVAFQSASTNLASPVGTGVNAFLWEGGSYQTVSVANGGGGQNGASTETSVTSTGRYISFTSSATNLIASDSNGVSDVFVRDHLTGATSLVSVTSTGAQGNGGSSGSSISSSGRYVAYVSGATNLVSGDTNAKTDVFLYDRGLSIPADRTFGFGMGAHSESPFTYWADPINTATGAFTNSETDLSLPGIGLPFQFTRSHTSADTASGSLGQGWRHNFTANLAVQPGGNIIFTSEDGQRITYGVDLDGTYQALSPGVHSTLKSVSGGYDLTRKDQVVYHFDSSGRLQTLKDRNANTLSMHYNASGNLDSITDTVGRVIALAYDASNHLTSVTLPDGRSVGYSYTSGLLTSVTDLRGGTISYLYDASSRLEKIIDQNGNTQVRNVYDVNGRVSEQYDAFNNKSTLRWNAATQTATMTDARGGVWTDVYANNILLSHTDPLGHAVSFQRDDDLNLISVTDARGNLWRMQYDVSGNLTKQIPPAPFTFTTDYAYNTKNDLTKFTDGRGNATSYVYDSAGNLTEVDQPGGVTTSMTRDASGNGLIATATDARGKTTTLTHDASGDLTALTTPLGFKTSFGYDASGRMTSRVEARGNLAGATPSDYTTSFTYDAADHLLTATDPLGHATTYAYDPVGALSSGTDANTHATSYAYNAAEELASVTASDLSATSYSYDASGNLVTRTDANTHATTFTYDAANRLTQRSSPLGQTWTYDYDAAGNRTQVVDANGNATPAPGDGTIAYAYDELNRLTSINYSDATPDVSFVYDADNNRTQMTDGAGTQARTYDALNRLTGVTRGSDSFSYGYDLNGDVTSRTYPDGAAASYTYDDDDRMSRASSGSLLVDYTHDAAGHLTVAAPNNSTVETSTFDRAGRLTGVSSVKGSLTFAQASYVLDPVGNPTSMTSVSSTTTYSYDNRDRLTQVCFSPTCTGGTGDFISYGYDAVGNKLSEARPSKTTSYTYNIADELTSRTTGATPVTYAYDHNGNETSEGSRVFNYDLANRTTAIVDTLPGGVPLTYAYTYDGDGKRLSANTNRAGLLLSATSFVWDPNAGIANLALERDGTGATVRDYAYGPELAFMQAGTKASFYHHDGLGSVVAQTDTSGSLQRSYSYEPYGALKSEVDTDPTAPANPMRFTGQYSDQGSGLYHLRARQYDPADGRFTATDPLGSSAGTPAISAYAYASNQPTTRADPSGLRDFGTNDRGGLSGWWDTWKAGYAVTPSWAKWADGIAITASGGFIACFATGVAACVAIGSSGAGLAGEEVEGETTQLFRTVSNVELQDIGETGFYRSPAGLEGKYFFPTPEQAANLAAAFTKAGLGVQNITSGRISTTLLERFADLIQPAGEGPAFFVPNELLPFIMGARGLQ